MGTNARGAFRRFGEHRWKESTIYFRHYGSSFDVIPVIGCETIPAGARIFFGESISTPAGGEFVQPLHL
jgi:hypothetical protein